MPAALRLIAVLHGIQFLAQAGRMGRMGSLWSIIGAGVLAGPPFILVMLQPDLGTALVFGAILATTLGLVLAVVERARQRRHVGLLEVVLRLLDLVLVVDVAVGEPALAAAFLPGCPHEVEDVLHALQVHGQAFQAVGHLETGVGDGDAADLLLPELNEAVRGQASVVLHAPPGAGKTTLLDAAAAAGISTSPEVARELLKTPGGMALPRKSPFGPFVPSAMTCGLSSTCVGRVFSSTR